MKGYFFNSQEAFDANERGQENLDIANAFFKRNINKQASRLYAELCAKLSVSRKSHILFLKGDLMRPMGAAILEKLALTQKTLFKNKTLHQLSLMAKSHEISFKSHVTTA